MLDATEARIRQYRTAPLTVRVVDASGKPLASQAVRVQHLRHLFRFGAALHGDIAERPGETDADRRHREAFLSVFNAATVTFYWAGYEPERGVWKDEERLRRIAWLQERGIVVRGHPLFWNHEQACVPKWLAGMTLTRDEGFALMDATLRHASETLLPHLRDADVFNELTDWDRNTKSPLTQIVGGPDKIVTATRYLQAFKSHNPGVQTVVNDYVKGPEYAALLHQLVDAGAPVDAIGQQSHMHDHEWTVAELWTILDRLATLNRAILFTELSVLSGPKRPDMQWNGQHEAWESDPEHERDQADYLEQFYRLLYSHPRVEQVTYWNYSDRGAWMGAPVGLLRKDGTPKPAFARLDRLINHDWRTSGTFTTDARGEVVVPGAFEGVYRVSAGTAAAETQHRPGQPATIVLTVARSGA